MGGTSPVSKTLSVQEIEQQVLYLLGDEFISKSIDQASENSVKFLYNKLYEQLESIITLSSDQQLFDKDSEQENVDKVEKQSDNNKDEKQEVFDKPDSESRDSKEMPQEEKYSGNFLYLCDRNLPKYL
jgi:hypothetical protein